MEVERVDFVSEKGFEEGIDLEPKKGFEEGLDFVPEKGFYQPRNDESWESYQALFCVVEEQLSQLGRFPQIVVCSVADEILEIFRNRYLSQIQKQYEVDKLIGFTSIDVFNQLVLSTNEIRDYNRAIHGETSSKNGEEGYFYQPRSSETWRIYNLLLNAIVDECGVQPHLVLCFAANELIAVLKNEEITENELKKDVIGDILNLGFVSDKLVFDLVAIVGEISDYSPGEFVDPTDLIREDVLMMMMGGEEKKGVCLCSDDEDEDEDDLMVEGGEMGFFEDDLMVKNGEKCEELVKDVEEKLVLNEEDEDEDGGLGVKDVAEMVKENLVLNEEDEDEEDGLGVRDVAEMVKEKLVLNEEDEDEDDEDWVVV